MGTFPAAKQYASDRLILYEETSTAAEIVNMTRIARLRVASLRSGMIVAATLGFPRSRT